MSVYVCVYVYVYACVASFVSLCANFINKEGQRKCYFYLISKTTHTHTHKCMCIVHVRVCVCVAVHVCTTYTLHALKM